MILTLPPPAVVEAFFDEQVPKDTARREDDCNPEQYTRQVRRPREERGDCQPFDAELGFAKDIGAQTPLKVEHEGEAWQNCQSDGEPEHQPVLQAELRVQHLELVQHEKVQHLVRERIQQLAEVRDLVKLPRRVAVEEVGDQGYQVDYERYAERIVLQRQPQG